MASAGAAFLPKAGRRHEVQAGNSLGAIRKLTSSGLRHGRAMSRCTT